MPYIAILTVALFAAVILYLVIDYRRYRANRRPDNKDLFQK